MAVSTVGVVGAGQMGSGIAQVTAQAGVRVVMNDVSQEMCNHGLDAIGRNLDRMVQRGRFKPEERDRVIARIETTTNLEDLASADFVIEAVVENEDAKIGLFQKLDQLCPPEVIFASNTSSISITRMVSRVSARTRSRYQYVAIYGPIACRDVRPTVDCLWAPRIWPRTCLYPVLGPPAISSP